MYTYTVGKRNQIDSVFTNGYSRQFAGDAEGVDYGVGVYCNISYNANETPRESLGRFNRDRFNNCIFKNELSGGLERFLIFDEHYATKVYGENHSIKDQVYRLLPKPDADSLWNDMLRYIRMDTSPQGNGNHMRGRTAGLLQFMMSKHLRGSVAQPEKFERIFAKHNIRGAIYRGNMDGLCIVVYNYDEIKPVAYSVDGGKTYIKKNVKFTYPDVVRKLRGQYKEVGYPVAVECEGEIYYFAKVKKFNGKYNYIDAKTNKSISPVDFDSVTTINPSNGCFQIEYGGKFYDACPDGFYDKEGEGHTWDELPTFNDEISDDFFDMDESYKKFDNILNESINGVISEYNMFSDILNELNEDLEVNNGLDEFNYDGFEVPDEYYFDSPNVPSIYHITPRANIDSIFKTGFDREFKVTCAYGDGLYAAYDIPNARNQLGSYGDAMIQVKLIGGYKRFLFFIDGLARKYYGEHHSIVSQLKTFMSEHNAVDLYHKCGNNVARYAAVAGQYGIRGAVYQWGRTIAVLPFDFSTGVPYAYSLDGGKTFKKRMNKEVFQRFQTSIDVDWKYGHKYRKIDKTIAGPNENGEMTGFARVLKFNRKYNYIDVQTGKEQLPFDFDSITTMNPDTGCFQVEYKGKFYDACLDGFYDKNGGEHTWDELPNFQDPEDNIDDDFFDDL